MRKIITLVPAIYFLFCSLSFAAIPGDSNANGKLDLPDAIIILQALVGFRSAEPAPAVTTVTGSVVVGFVSGATVQAYQISANGTRGAATGSATTTDANGNYTLNLGTHLGPVLIEATGGTYKDWTTGAAVTLGAADKLSAVISNATSPVTVTAMVTPLTHMAAQRAQQDIAINGTPVDTAIETANADVGAYFGGFNILADKPIDPTVAGSAVGASQNSIDYAMVLAGISRNASSKGLQPFSLINAMGKDAGDGAFDGKQGATQLMVTTTAGGTANLVAADAKGDLSAGIATFQNSLGNTSGGEVTAAIPTNLGSVTNPGTVFAKPNPPTQFTAASSSSSQIDLTWTAANGATGYNVYQNGTLKKSVSTTAAADAGLTAGTNYCYRVTALDAAGKQSLPTGQLCVTTMAAPLPASIELLASNPQLNSDGASTVALTAVVKDSSNRALSGQMVDFAADSGSLIVSNGTTDNSGSAMAMLGTGNDPANRIIFLTAATGALSVSNAVTVAGTTIGISGLHSLSMGSSTDLTISLNNSAGTGIPGKTVMIVSQKGNTITLPNPPITNAGGQMTVNVEAAVSGDDVIMAAALGAAKTFALNVNPSVLTMTAPLSWAEAAIGSAQPVRVTLTNAGMPMVGALINFMTTRGALSSATSVTATDGTASVNLSSTTAGPALLSAYVTGGASVQRAIEFVATNPAMITLQADPVIIGANSAGETTQKSLITTVVRDADGNPVKNMTVNFTLISDVSGGSLSPASATTDSSGVASVHYIAGASSTGNDGVKISTTVAGYPAVTADTTLTVSQKAIFISLGTGPGITSLTNLLYQQNYLALVTDVTGAPIPGVAITATLTPQYYQKGYYVVSGSAWQRVPTLVAASATRPDVPACANEDGITHNPLYDFNGFLDPGEDQNSNNRLDPGNIASVQATVTDSNGFSTISITFAKEYAYWANVRLLVRAATEGLSDSAEADFNLPGTAADFSDITIAPPGHVSPFGISTTCFVDLTVTPISSSRMTIAWQNSATADHYHIYRDGINVGSVTQSNYTDTGLTGGTQYCYQIKTVDGLGMETAFTEAVCANTSAPAPPTPTGLTATGLKVDGPPISYMVTLNWNASMGASLYRIYRDGMLMLSTPGTTANDIFVSSQTGYCYTISATDSSGNESEQSVSVCTATP